jgi:hypothetical protein
VLQFVLSGRDSAKCGEIADYFESMARIIKYEDQIPTPPEAERKDEGV